MSILSEIDRANALIVGASQGIGLGFVQQLLLNPAIAKIFATYRNAESATELLTLAQKHPDRLKCFVVDITQESQIAESVKKIGTEVKQLHLAINCVGILHEGALQPEKSLRQIDPDKLMRYFQVNSIGGSTAS